MTRQEILSIAKPILFNTEMVKALLEGRKTATRRVMKPQPLFKTHRKYVFADDVCPKKWEGCDDIIATYQYQPGDYLYVRETWCEFPKGTYHRKADFTDDEIKSKTYWFEKEKNNLCDLPKWHPSIHMEKENSRIFLFVTNVRVERLQDIPTLDIQKEGVVDAECDKCREETGDCYPQKDVDVFCGIEEILSDKYADLWDSTIKKQDLDRYGWDANPWVWVIEFEIVKAE